LYLLIKLFFIDLTYLTYIHIEKTTSKTIAKDIRLLN
jgi:hypothetical protein